MMKTLLHGRADGHRTDRARRSAIFTAGAVNRAAPRRTSRRGARRHRFRHRGLPYALTDLGRDRATQYLEINRYVGPAPVSLASYVSAMKAIRQTRGFIDLERLQQGFSHLVISDGSFRPVGASRQRRKGDISLRPPRQRQDGDRRRPWARPRRRHVRAARASMSKGRSDGLRSDLPRVF